MFHMLLLTEDKCRIRIEMAHKITRTNYVVYQWCGSGLDRNKDPGSRIRNTVVYYYVLTSR
jgi:hypothetical protein